MKLKLLINVEFFVLCGKFCNVLSLRSFSIMTMLFNPHRYREMEISKKGVILSKLPVEISFTRCRSFLFSVIFQETSTSSLSNVDPDLDKISLESMQLSRNWYLVSKSGLCTWSTQTASIVETFRFVLHRNCLRASSALPASRVNFRTGQRRKR